MVDRHCYMSALNPHQTAKRTGTRPSVFARAAVCQPGRVQNLFVHIR